MNVVPESSAIAAWLAHLETERLVVPSPRLVIEAERLRRNLIARGVQDPAEMSHAFASLLAKDRRRWQQIANHFCHHFDALVKGGGDGATEPDNPIPNPPRPFIPAVFHLLINGLRQFSRNLRRRKRNSSGKTRVSLVAAVVIMGVFAVLNGAARIVPSQPVVPWCRTGLTRPAAKIVTVEKQWAVEPVRASLQGFITKPSMANAATPTPETFWLQIVLTLFAICISVVAARWRFATEDYANDFVRFAKKSAAARDELLRSSNAQGIPYHIDRVPPMATHAIDDAATLLGRITRHEEGVELNIPATIQRTIDAGGRVVPVYARGIRREAIVVLVDIEEGEHPYRDGAEWILERWQRLGVKFVRYDYRDRPGNLFAHPDRRPVTIEALARRTEGAPLLIWSRMELPQDYDGKIRWLGTLAPWPVRAWIDLDPRGIAERPRGNQRVISRIAAGLTRFSCTARGLIACATSLTSDGKMAFVAGDDLLRPATDDDVEQALRLWAAAACCVPDPTWAHLDSLRRQLPEIAVVLPDRRYVQRLIDWVNANEYGEGTMGLGPSLRFRRTARIKLITSLRAFDAKAPKTNKSIEHRARELLIKQLRAADVEMDPFEKLRRDMKMRVHEAILDPSKAEELLAEFADSAVALELRELLGEELELQARGALTSGSRGWSSNMRHATKAWTTGKGVRLRDLLRLDRWNRRRTALALLFVGLVGASWAIWSITRRRPPTAEHLAHATGAIYRVVDERPVAIALVAPMPFVVLPGGQFLMGSPMAEKQNNDDEAPQQAISVKPFELAIHEVTQKQWEIVMGSQPSQCAFGCDDELPVQNVSWYDAAMFVNRLTDRENEGKAFAQRRTRCYDETEWTWDRSCTGYRLPTEAEWEYAARAGSTTAFSFGDDPAQLCRYGNGADLSTKKKQPAWFDCNDRCNDGFAELAPIGSFKANAWGIFDMHGNVYEWVWNIYQRYAAPSVDNSQTGVESKQLRVLRGGSFLSDPGTMRSAYRRAGNPSTHNMIMGFRCARSVSDGQ